MRSEYEANEALASGSDGFFEVPNGYRDADLEMARLTALGNKSARLRKSGICTHTWLQGFEGKPTKCLHCHKVFPTLEAAWAESNDRLHS